MKASTKASTVTFRGAAIRGIPRLRLLIVLLSVIVPRTIVTTMAFSVRSGTITVSQRRNPRKHSTTQIYVNNQDSKDASTVTTTTGVAVAKETAPANKMDETIFTFNKVLIDTVYDLICLLYPVRGTPRDFARFYVLETVARVPYFAYLSVLHLRETFGERDLGEKMRTHYAEADNELHHLLIMEELGGNENPVDRFLAQSMAFAYYWYVVLVYLLSPPSAYHLSELIEDHAYETYDGFLQTHAEMLKQRPVPQIAIKYYMEDNPFMFDQFCTVKQADAEGNFSARRPQLKSLYDVFVNIRDDEKEHWKTLCNLVQFGSMQGVDGSQVVSTEPRKE